MATQTASRLEATAQRFRDELERETTDAVDRMARAHLAVLRRVEIEVQLLLSKLEAARLAGVKPSPAWLYQQGRLANVLETITRELAKAAPLAEEETRLLAYRAAARAQEGAQTLAREAAQADRPGVAATFGDISPENMATVLGHLAPGGPLRDLLVSLAGEAASAAQDVLVQGVLLGKGSDWITGGLRRALDIPRWRAETIARTEALRAYRETSRLTFQSSNVVGSWVWTAALDRRTCPACMVMHGTVHPLTEKLDGHPRCRCAMVPRTKSWAELGLDPSLDELFPPSPIRTGKDWWAQQSALTQRAMVGPAKWAELQAGRISLDDMVARTRSPEWGTMRRERSLAEIREGRNANHGPGRSAKTG